MQSPNSYKTEHKIGDCKYLVDHTNKEIYIEQVYDGLDDQGFKCKKYKWNPTAGSYKVFLEDLKRLEEKPEKQPVPVEPSLEVVGKKQSSEAKK